MSKYSSSIRQLQEINLVEEPNEFGLSRLTQLLSHLLLLNSSFPVCNLYLDFSGKLQESDKPD